jgi:organic radical activating enzyme
MKKYRVKAVWKTLQGEGHYAGRPAIFIRFVGCNLWSGYEKDRQRDAERNDASCPLWCDTDFTKEGSQAYNAEELISAIQFESTEIRFCVFTGGEPLLQIDSGLIKKMHEHGYEIAIETNGTITLESSCLDPDTNTLYPPDWIVCSPKLPQERLVLEYFDEIKLVVPSYHPDKYKMFAEKQREHMLYGRKVPLLWLQPEDGARIDESIRQAVSIALENPSWRVSAQTH